MKFTLPLALLVTAAAPAQAVTYSFTPIVVSTGTFSARSLNDRGQFFGELGNLSPQGFGLPAIDDHGVVTPVNLPGAGSNLFTEGGINNAGDVAGHEGGGGTHFISPFVYQNGAVVSLGLPTGNTSASGINNLGQVVGFTGPGFGLSGVTHGFLYSGGAITTLDAPGGYATYATGLNDTGQIVGDYNGTGGGTSNPAGFLLSNGTYTTIAVPGATSTRPAAINNSGEIVGEYSTGTTERGFVQSGGAFSDITGPNGAAFIPTGLNNLGQIVGTFGGTGLTYLGTPDAALPVPEPATLALLGGGVAALAGGRAGARRRRTGSVAAGLPAGR